MSILTDKKKMLERLKLQEEGKKQQLNVIPKIKLKPKDKKLIIFNEKTIEKKDKDNEKIKKFFSELSELLPEDFTNVVKTIIIDGYNLYVKKETAIELEHLAYTQDISDDDKINTELDIIDKWENENQYTKLKSE